MSFYRNLKGRTFAQQSEAITWLATDGGVLRFTYEDLWARIARTSAWLRARGLQRGDVLALQLPKGPLFLELHLAALSQGIVTLPLNPSYSAQEVAFYLEDSCARLALRLTDEPIGTCEIVASPTAQAAIATELRSCQAAELDADDPAVILYTSGTTGRPKGAVLRHRNIQAAVESLNEAWRWSSEDRLLHTLPLFHVHGLFVAQFGALWAGAHTVSLPRFTPEDWLRCIEEYRATVVMGVPTHYNRLLALPPTASRDLSSLRLVTSGSAPLPAAVHQAFEERFGHRILERYGMTEVGIVLSNPYEGERRPGTVGFPLPGVRARIGDPDSGTTLPPNTVGEVRIAGPSVFTGYLGLPEQSARALEDGWMRTGDLGFVDEDGYFHIVGRSKDMIISGGLNIYPREVEAALLTHAAVAEAAVVGVPDPDFGERVVASVVLREEVDSARLIAWCRDHLAAFKVPKRIEAVEALPRNAMGKIQKQRLRETWRRPNARPATPEDAANLAAWQVAFRTSHPAAADADSPNQQLFVAEIAGGALGYLRVDAPLGGTWSVVEVYVLPSVRRLGAARALWTRAVHAAAAASAPRLEWIVPNGSKVGQLVGARLAGPEHSHLLRYGEDDER